MITVGPNDLGTPAHFISSPRPMPRRKKCPRTNEGNPNCQDILLRTTLSSADQSHGREGTASPEAVPSRKADSVDSYRQLTQAFGFRIVTNSRGPQPLSALLSLSMRDGETLKTYSGRYWEMYNEMEGNFDGVAINHFKSNLPNEHGLRKSLTGKPATSMRQLMDRIEKYKRVEED